MSTCRLHLLRTILRCLLLSLMAGILLAISGCFFIDMLQTNERPAEQFTYTVLLESSDIGHIFSVFQAGTVQGADWEHAQLQVRVDGVTLFSETLRDGGSRLVRLDLPFIDVGVSPTLYMADADGQAARASLADELASMSSVSEMANGMPARRYDLSGAQLMQLAVTSVSLPPGTDAPIATLWVSEEMGTPIRVAMVAPGVEGSGSLYLEINVTPIEHVAVADSRRTPTTQRGEGGQISTRDEPTKVEGLDALKALLGGAISAVTGVDPFNVSDAVDDVADNVDSIMENIENVDEYYDAYPEAPDRERYTLATEDLSNKTWLYKWFWGLWE